jgi:hypothetical protein
MTKLIQSQNTLVQTPGTAGYDVTQWGGRDKCIRDCPGTMTFFVLPCANDLIKSDSLSRHSVSFAIKIPPYFSIRILNMYVTSGTGEASVPKKGKKDLNL